MLEKKPSVKLKNTFDFKLKFGSEEQGIEAETKNGETVKGNILILSRVTDKKRKMSKAEKLPSLKNSSGISDLMAEANATYLVKDYARSKEILQECVKTQPESLEPYKLLSLIYQEEGNIRKALDFLTIAAQLSRKDTDIWVECTLLNKKLGDYQQANYCLYKALKVDRYNPYLLFEKASIQESLGNLNMAAKTYNRVCTLLTSVETPLLVHTAQLYDKAGYPEKSLEVLEDTLEKTKDALTTANLALDYVIKLGKYSRYEQICKKLSKIDPKSAESVDIKFKQRIAKYLYESKEEDIQAALELAKASNSVAFLNTIATTLGKKGCLDKYLDLFENAITEQRELSKSVYLTLGNICRETGKSESAIRFYSKLIDSSLDSVQLRLYLSEEYKKIGDYSAALSILKNLKKKQENEEENVEYSTLSFNQCREYLASDLKAIAVESCEESESESEFEEESQEQSEQSEEDEEEELLSRKRFRFQIPSITRKNSSVSRVFSKLGCDYEDVKESIASNQAVYLKIQESLVYLDNNQKKEFISTLEPILKGVIELEIKIEELESEVFESILKKSNVKNYFNKVNTAIFEEEQGEAPNESNPLFNFKNSSKSTLSRKKVRESTELTAQLMSKLNNVYSKMQPEKFLSICYLYAFYKTEEEDFSESDETLQRLLSLKKAQ